MSWGSIPYYTDEKTEDREILRVQRVTGPSARTHLGRSFLTTTRRVFGKAVIQKKVLFVLFPTKSHSGDRISAASNTQKRLVGKRAHEKGTRRSERGRG